MSVFIIAQGADFSGLDIGKVEGLNEPPETDLPSGLDPSLAYWFTVRQNARITAYNLADPQGKGGTPDGTARFGTMGAVVANSGSFVVELDDFKDRAPSGVFTIFSVAKWNGEHPAGGNQTAFHAYGSPGQADSNTTLNMRFYTNKQDLRLNMRNQAGDPVNVDALPGLNVSPTYPMLAAAVVDIPNNTASIWTAGGTGQGPLPSGMAATWDAFSGAVAFGRRSPASDDIDRTHYLFALFAKAMNSGEVEATAGKIVTYLQARGVAGVLGL